MLFKRDLLASGHDGLSPAQRGRRLSACMPLCRSLYRLLGCLSHPTMLFLALVQRAQNAQRGRVRAVIAPVAPAEIGELLIEIARMHLPRASQRLHSPVLMPVNRAGARSRSSGSRCRARMRRLEEIRAILDRGRSAFRERRALDGGATPTGSDHLGRPSGLHPEQARPRLQGGPRLPGRGHITLLLFTVNPPLRQDT